MIKNCVSPYRYNSSGGGVFGGTHEGVRSGRFDRSSEKGKSPRITREGGGDRERRKKNNEESQEKKNREQRKGTFRCRLSREKRGGGGEPPATRPAKLKKGRLIWWENRVTSHPSNSRTGGFSRAQGRSQRFFRSTPDWKEVRPAEGEKGQVMGQFGTFSEGNPLRSLSETNF